MAGNVPGSALFFPPGGGESRSQVSSCSFIPSFSPLSVLPRLGRPLCRVRTHSQGRWAGIVSSSLPRPPLQGLGAWSWRPGQARDRECRTPSVPDPGCFPLSKVPTGLLGPDSWRPESRSYKGWDGGIRLQPPHQAFMGHQPHLLAAHANGRPGNGPWLPCHMAPCAKPALSRPRFSPRLFDREVHGRAGPRV